VQPDILILDEVLSVGDESFKNKCKQRMDQFWDDDATVLVVSHDLAFISTSCKKAIYLSQGNIRFQGESQEVVDYYLERIKKSEVVTY
jgi:ABC-2 type transport system ATP-binding protein/lipopolysaccharide transport system ATP-binding protein